MPQMQYVVADLVSGEAREELPLTEVSLGRQLGGGGSFSASLLLTPELRDLKVWDITTPAKTVIWSLRDSIPVGCHLIWVRKYNYGTSTMTLEGAELWSVLRRRQIRTTKTFTNSDTAAIAEVLVLEAQSELGAALHMGVSGSKSGVKVSRTIYAAENRAVADEINDLSLMGNGFQFEIRPKADMSGTTFVPNPGGPPLSAALPGNLTGDVTLTSDGAATATAITVLGGGDVTSLGVAQGRSVDMEAISAGYPILDATIQAPSVSNERARAEFARGLLELRSRGAEYGSLPVTPDDPPFGSYVLGSPVRLVVEDPDRLGPEGGGGSWATLAGWTYTPQSDDQLEQVVWEVARELGGL